MIITIIILSILLLITSYLAFFNPKIVYVENTITKDLEEVEKLELIRIFDSIKEADLKLSDHRYKVADLTNQLCKLNNAVLDAKQELENEKSKINRKKEPIAIKEDSSKSNVEKDYSRKNEMDALKLPLTLGLNTSAQTNKKLMFIDLIFKCEIKKCFIQCNDDSIISFEINGAHSYDYKNGSEMLIEISKTFLPTINNALIKGVSNIKFLMQEGSEIIVPRNKIKSIGNHKEYDFQVQIIIKNFTMSEREKVITIDDNDFVNYSN
jgi:PHD/YefM family antitoxin component YafN of YafNO toxin-antitoxin module